MYALTFHSQLHADSQPRMQMRHAAGMLAFAMALCGLVVLALPLGMLSAYLGWRTAVSIQREQGPMFCFSVAAVAAVIGACDAGVSIGVLLARLLALGGTFVLSPI
jgi:hypothetical protein